MVLVVGVDGCPGGWLAMGYDPDLGHRFSLRIHPSFDDLLAAWDEAAVIAVDIPIGLVEGGPRLCDLTARRLLGRRGSSVFPAPDPRVVMIEEFRDANARFRELEDKGVSKQAFGIFKKVAEVDAILTPAMQERMIEVHPEVSFWALAGKQVMTYSKKEAAGFSERRDALVGFFSEESIPRRDEIGPMVRSAYLAAKVSAKSKAAADDVLDAIVAAWSALRHSRGESERVCGSVQFGANGLRAEIVF